MIGMRAEARLNEEKRERERERERERRAFFLGKFWVKRGYSPRGDGF